MDSVITYRARLFGLLGLREPLAYAEQLDPDCLTDFGLLAQAWKEIPASKDGDWMRRWMTEAREVEGAEELVAAFDRIRSVGGSNEDLATVVRGALGQFLYRFAYILDDNGFDDEELRRSIKFGVWAEDEDDEPLYRLGCMHELVFAADPENSERA